MACDEKILILISAFADGETSYDESTRAKYHLENCAECRLWLDERQAHLNMLHWAYTNDQPNIFEIESLIQPADKRRNIDAVKDNKKMQNRTNHKLPIFCWKLNKIYAVAVSLVAIFSIMLLINYFILSSSLKVGEQIIAERSNQIIKISRNISLKMDSAAKVTRIDNRSIRVDHGWIKASVVHGTGFRVITRRMEVIDKGTEFQVGTGSKADFIIVDEGSITVKKDHITKDVVANKALIVDDKNISEFVLEPANDDLEAPIKLAKHDFLPSNENELDWQDSNKHPGSIIEYCTGIDTSRGNLQYRCIIQPATGLRKQLRLHYHDLIKVLSGINTMNSWEIPVGFMQVYGITKPKKLPAGMYQIHLISNGKKIEWRLTDLSGNQTSFPVKFEKVFPESISHDNSKKHKINSWDWMYVGFSIVQNAKLSFGVQRQQNSNKLDAMIQIADWPSENKPVLRIGILGKPISEVKKNELKMLADVTKQTSKLKDHIFNQNSAYSFLYLDSLRKYRILTIVNTNVGEELIKLQYLKQQRKGGSVLVFAMATDVPLVQPSMPKGIYLIWYVVPELSQNPYWQITTIDMRNTTLLSKPQNVSQNEPSGYNRIKGLDHTPLWTSDTASPFGISAISFHSMGADDIGFPFRAMLQGLPGNENIEQNQGWIWVSKP